MPHKSLVATLGFLRKGVWETSLEESVVEKKMIRVYWLICSEIKLVYELIRSQSCSEAKSFLQVVTFPYQSACLINYPVEKKEGAKSAG